MMLLILRCHKSQALFIMGLVGMYAKHPLYTHAVSENVCVFSVVS